MILAIIAVFFGWGRLSNLGRNLGQGISAFRREVNKEATKEEQKPLPAPAKVVHKDPVPKEKAVAEPSMVQIPEGSFWMGSEAEQLQKESLDWQESFDAEIPYHEVSLTSYAISRYPITNAEYRKFVESGGEKPAYWEEKGFDDPLQPVVGVTWHQAMSYCQWLSEGTGKSYTLPSEAEWEKAARGDDGRLWPWGNRWAARRCHINQNDSPHPTPVGSFSTAGDSPYGLADMAGNIWEWTRSYELPYPYQVEESHADLDANSPRVVRGGSWVEDEAGVRCANRGQGQRPDHQNQMTGFRVVLHEDA